MINKCLYCNGAILRPRSLYCSKKCQHDKWVKDNPKKRLNHIRKYNENHREEQKIRSKEWYKKNREAALAWHKSKHQRDMNSGRTRAKVVVKNIPKVCSRCSASKNIHIHHIDKNPLNNLKSNLILLCSICHGKEHQAQ